VDDDGVPVCPAPAVPFAIYPDFVGAPDPGPEDPKNPFCEVCKVAKATEQPSRRVSLSISKKDAPGVFGEKVAVDFFVASCEEFIGLDDQHTALVLLDIGTRMRPRAPMGNRSEEDTIQAIMNVRGSAKIQFLRSDNAPELKAACRRLDIPNPTSTPYVSHSNGVVERAIRHLREGTRGPWASVYFSNACNFNQ